MILCALTGLTAGMGIGWILARMCYPFDYHSIAQDLVESQAEVERMAIDAASCRRAISKMNEQHEQLLSQLEKHRDVFSQIIKLEA